MKKTILMLTAAMLLMGCEKLEVPQTSNGVDAKTIRLNVNGDFGSPTFTRSTLSADGKDMTDLWIFDYVDDELVQTIHQESDDADFGEPELTLAYGYHHLYVVASRGLDPVVDDVEHNIVWSSVRDTFWADVYAYVDDETAHEQDVTLSRVVAKLKCTINDVVPTGVTTLTMSPDTWYYGLDYKTGEPVSEDAEPLSVAVPSSYAGTSGLLTASFFTISSSDEWKTDFTLIASDASNSTVTSITVDDAPLKANRATVYSGNFFSSSKSFSFILDDGWLDDKVLTW